MSISLKEKCWLNPKSIIKNHKAIETDAVIKRTDSCNAEYVTDEETEI